MRHVALELVLQVIEIGEVAFDLRVVHDEEQVDCWQPQNNLKCADGVHKHVWPELIELEALECWALGNLRFQLQLSYQC